MAEIRSLAWELPYATGAAIERQKKKVEKESWKPLSGSVSKELQNRNCLDHSQCHLEERYKNTKFFSEKLKVWFP